MTATNAILVYKTNLIRALEHIHVAQCAAERLAHRCVVPQERIERMAASISAVRKILEDAYGEPHESRKQRNQRV